MKTLVVAGSDTGVGKTWVTGILASALRGRGQSVQIVKPVETGTEPGRLGDALTAVVAAGLDKSAAYTLHSFGPAMAPVAAAKRSGVALEVETLAREIEELPPSTWRLVEGAGGLASPLEASGRDWRDLAQRLQAWRLVIVVADRLGAINQARLAYAYASGLGLKSGIWLNAVGAVDAEIACSNRSGLLDAGVPLWGESAFGQTVAARALDWIAL